MQEKSISKRECLTSLPAPEMSRNMKIVMCPSGGHMLAQFRMFRRAIHLVRLPMRPRWQKQQITGRYFPNIIFDE